MAALVQSLPRTWPSSSDNDADTIALSQSPDSKFIVRVSRSLVLNQKLIVFTPGCLKCQWSCQHIRRCRSYEFALHRETAKERHEHHHPRGNGALLLLQLNRVLHRCAASGVNRLTRLNFCFLQLCWHPSSELLSVSSHSKKEAFRLVHAPSFSVFSNWPTSSTPLHSVSSVAFSGNGMLQLLLSLMRLASLFDCL